MADGTDTQLNGPTGGSSDWGNMFGNDTTSPPPVVMTPVNNSTPADTEGFKNMFGGADNKTAPDVGDTTIPPNAEPAEGTLPPGQTVPQVHPDNTYLERMKQYQAYEDARKAQEAGWQQKIKQNEALIRNYETPGFNLNRASPEEYHKAQQNNETYKKNLADMAAARQHEGAIAQKAEEMGLRHPPGMGDEEFRQLVQKTIRDGDLHTYIVASQDIDPEVRKVAELNQNYVAAKAGEQTGKADELLNKLTSAANVGPDAYKAVRDELNSDPATKNTMTFFGLHELPKTAADFNANASKFGADIASVRGLARDYVDNQRRMTTGEIVKMSTTDKDGKEQPTPEGKAANAQFTMRGPGGATVIPGDVYRVPAPGGGSRLAKDLGVAPDELPQVGKTIALTTRDDDKAMKEALSPHAEHIKAASLWAEQSQNVNDPRFPENPKMIMSYIDGSARAKSGKSVSMGLLNATEALNATAEEISSRLHLEKSAVMNMLTGQGGVRMSPEVLKFIKDDVGQQKNIAEKQVGAELAGAVRDYMQRGGSLSNIGLPEDLQGAVGDAAREGNKALMDRIDKMQKLVNPDTGNVLLVAKGTPGGVGDLQPYVAPAPGAANPNGGAAAPGAAGGGGGGGGSPTGPVDPNNPTAGRKVSFNMPATLPDGTPPDDRARAAQAQLVQTAGKTAASLGMTPTAMNHIQALVASAAEGSGYNTNADNGLFGYEAGGDGKPGTGGKGDATQQIKDRVNSIVSAASKNPNIKAVLDNPAATPDQILGALTGVSVTPERARAIAPALSRMLGVSAAAPGQRGALAEGPVAPGTTPAARPAAGPAALQTTAAAPPAPVTAVPVGPAASPPPVVATPVDGMQHTSAPGGATFPTTPPSAAPAATPANLSTTPPPPVTALPVAPAGAAARPQALAPAGTVKRVYQELGATPGELEVIHIESGFQNGQVTGNNVGHGQFSPDLLKRYGITNPDDPAQVLKGLRLERLDFEKAAGRPISDGEFYMSHQQGQAGGPALLRASSTAPNAPAWQTVRQFYPNDNVAKRAIWGNVPDNVKAQFGNVDNVSNAAFTNMWTSRFGGATAGPRSGGFAVVNAPFATPGGYTPPELPRGPAPRSGGAMAAPFVTAQAQARPGFSQMPDFTPPAPAPAPAPEPVQPQPAAPAAPTAATPAPSGYTPEQAQTIVDDFTKRGIPVPPELAAMARPRTQPASAADAKEARIRRLEAMLGLPHDDGEKRQMVTDAVRGVPVLGAISAAAQDPSSAGSPVRATANAAGHLASDTVQGATFGAVNPEQMVNEGNVTAGLHLPTETARAVTNPDASWSDVGRAALNDADAAASMYVGGKLAPSRGGVASADAEHAATLAKGRPPAPSKEELTAVKDGTAPAETLAKVHDHASYQAAEAYAKAAGKDPAELVYQHRTAEANAAKPEGGKTSRLEAVAARPQEIERAATQAEYNNMHADVGTSQAPVPRVKLKDGPASMERFKTTDRQWAGRAQEAEDAITAPIADVRKRWQQDGPPPGVTRESMKNMSDVEVKSRDLQDVRSGYLARGRDTTLSQAERDANNAIAANIRQQQELFYKNVVYPKNPEKAAATIAKLNATDVRYAKLMSATGNGDIITALRSTNTREQAKALKVYQNFAQDAEAVTAAKAIAAGGDEFQKWAKTNTALRSIVAGHVASGIPSTAIGVASDIVRQAVHKFTSIKAAGSDATFANVLAAEVERSRTMRAGAAMGSPSAGQRGSSTSAPAATPETVGSML